MILDYLRDYAKTDRIAVTQYTYKQNLSYRELWESSEKIAHFILTKSKEKRLEKRPVVIIGHKDVDMVTCFISAIKAGIAYCPIDIYTPSDRINNILEAISPHFVIVPERNINLPEGIEFRESDVINAERLRSIINNTESITINEEDYLQPDELVYIMFTSGSTGKPKGVQIMLKNLESETEWLCGLSPAFSYSEKASTHINQAPFPFDLSIMDLYPTLKAGRKIGRAHV